MGFFERLQSFFNIDNKKPAVAAGATVGILGLITITTTQVVTPNDPEPPPSEFPTISSVGPATDPTITYTGDCNFDSTDNGLIIDARIVNCNTDGLRFAAGNYTVTFRNSIIYGQMFTFQYTPGDAGADDFPKAPIFVVENSDIIQLSTANGQDRAACCSHFTITDSYVLGTHSGLGAHNNVSLDGNYITTDGSSTHQSGLRALKNTSVTNNTVICKPHGNANPANPAYEYNDDSGCSAAAVFYAEDLGGIGTAAFNLTINHNYFKIGTTAGGQLGAPYNATRFIDCEARVDCVDIQFTNNQMDLGWGVDGDEFPLTYGGNVFSGNVWTDGLPATSGQVR